MKHVKMPENAHVIYNMANVVSIYHLRNIAERHLFGGVAGGEAK